MTQQQRVMIHTRVELELITESGEREPLVVQLADGRSANLAEGWMDIDAPLGRAIRGQAEGARVPYKMGDIVAVRIVSVVPVAPPIARPGDDAEARRQEILEDARRKSEQTTQEIFSSSYGSKWGAYYAEDLASGENGKAVDDAGNTAHKE